MSIHLNIVSSSETIFSGEVDFASLPGESGELGIMPQHAPLLTRIKPGVVRFRLTGKTEETTIFVAGGILEVLPQRVTVLADTAVRAQDLDEARALEAKKKSEEALKSHKGKMEHAQAMAELAIAAAELQAIQKLRKRR